MLGLEGDLEGDLEVTHAWVMTYIGVWEVADVHNYPLWLPYSLNHFLWLAKHSMSGGLGGESCWSWR